MSDGKSYWSTLPGVVTGIASIVTAIVGLLGISVQAGWIGGDDKSSASSSDGVATTTSSTLRGATTTSSPSMATTRVGEFEVKPQSVTFEPLKTKEATITVRNTGDVALTVRAPVLSGSGESAFTIADQDCTNSTLAPGRSCDITVAFAATQPGEFAAKLVVAASNAPRQVEVDVKGERGLLG